MSKVKKPLIFFSYSRMDSEFALKLAADLKACGVDVWLDQANLEIGQQFYDQIRAAIQDADYMLVLMSATSLHSDWIKQEVDLALGRGRGIVIPVLIDRDAVPFVPESLKDIQWLDLSDPSSYYERLDRFARQIEAKRTPQTEERVERKDFRGRPADVELPPAKPQREPAQPALTVSDILNSDEFAKRIANQVTAALASMQAQGGHLFSSQPKSEIKSDLIFVIMAFSEDMDPVFDGIKAAANAAGFEARRVKDIVGDYKITSKVVECIAEAAMIVADLTHERPNVYFELGYARGVGKTVITTARNDARIHFDVRDWTCTLYSDSRILERSLKERFLIERNRLGRGAIQPY